MGKFLKYSVAIILIVFILIFIALRIPSVQDRLLNIGLANLINAESPLTQEDALSAIVCGSRSPLPAAFWRNFINNLGPNCDLLIESKSDTWDY